MGCGGSHSSTAKADAAVTQNNIDHKALAKEANKSLIEIILFLGSTEFFTAFPMDVHPLIAGRCKYQSCDPGEDFCVEDAGPAQFFLLVDGHAEAHVDGDNPLELKARDCFAMCLAHCRHTRVAARLTAIRGPAKCIVCPRDWLEECGLREQVWMCRKEWLEEAVQGVQQDESQLNAVVRCGTSTKLHFADGSTSLWSVERSVLNGERRTLSSSAPVLDGDMDRFGVIGHGGFATVELVKHKETQQIFAMRSTSKGYVVKTGMQDSFLNEKRILERCCSEFIVGFHGTLNSKQYIYFLLEPLLGGELYATYNRKGLHGSHKHAKHHAASVCLALDYLHHRHVMYRDLKPENGVFDTKGRLKLVDMQLSKYISGKTYTTCGTPDYFAPEMIASIGHNHAVDWWCLGIFVFELLSGHPPFESAYPMQIYSKVMKGINTVPFPSKVQEKGAAEFVKALLKKEPTERLPMKPGGFSNLEGTEWYKGFDWAGLRAGALDPPYKPLVTSPTDMSNFKTCEDDRPRFVEYVNDGSNWDMEFGSEVYGLGKSEEILQILDCSEFFTAFPSRARRNIAYECDWKVCESGEEFCVEDAAADFFFLVVEGLAEVAVNGARFVELKAYDCFAMCPAERRRTRGAAKLIATSGPAKCIACPRRCLEAQGLREHVWMFRKDCIEELAQEPATDADIKSVEEEEAARELAADANIFMESVVEEAAREPAGDADIVDSVASSSLRRSSSSRSIVGEEEEIIIVEEGPESCSKPEFTKASTINEKITKLYFANGSTSPWLVESCVWVQQGSQCEEQGSQCEIIELTFFDNEEMQGEKIRLALSLTDTPFKDNRLDSAGWAKLKPNTKYGQLPMLTLDGLETFQSGAILRWAGTLGDGSLYPHYDKHMFRKVEEMLGLSDDLEHASLIWASAGWQEKDSTVKEELQRYMGFLSAELKQTGAFLAGYKPTIADCQWLPQIVSLTTVKVDHIPKDFLQEFPLVIAWMDRMSALPGIRRFYDKRYTCL